MQVTAGCSSMVMAYYDRSEDMYVVEFLTDAIFAAFGDKQWQWGMFTHGVCADVVNDSTFEWNRIGITGRYLFYDDEPAREHLGQRLDQAADRLSAMYRSRPADWPTTAGQRRCQEGARILSICCEQIMSDLITSWREEHRTSDQRTV